MHPRPLHDALPISVAHLRAVLGASAPPEAALQIDLTGVVREELALEVPAFVLCREDCAGLCPTCGADLNAGPCACVRSAEPA